MNENSWSLAAIEHGGKEETVAMLPGGEYRTVDVLPEGISPIEVFKRWDEFASVLKSWDPQSGKKVDGKLLPPLRYPSKVICVGANYSEHRKETEIKTDGELSSLLMFFKPPTTAIIGPGDDVLIRSEEDNIDWEAEVAIVIGKKGRFIKPENAFEHIAGYTLINDVSARGAFHFPDRGHPALEYDWIGMKGHDTFCPTGPAVMPAWFVKNPDDIPFTLTVNGVEEQNGSTSDLIFGMQACVAAASEYITLEPGDMIATGTCGGVGLAKGRFLKAGDVVVVSSPLLGRLENTIRKIKR